MPLYKFRGRDVQGQETVGQRQAQSADTLGAQLYQEGIVPIVITPLAQGAVSYWSKLHHELTGRRVPTTEISMFTRQMYIMCKAGIPITSAFKRLSEISRNPKMVAALNGIVENLESGQDLASAAQSYTDIFTPLMISIIRVGQNSGHLDDAFFQLTQYLEMEGDVGKRIKTTLRYPITVLIAVVSAIVMINMFVIPTFANVFASSHLELPFVTKMLISMSNFMREYWVYLLCVLAAIIFSIRMYLNSTEGKLKWHKTQLKLPIIGSILNRIILGRFAKSFALIIRSGVPLAEGIRFVALAIGNEYARTQILAMGRALEHGENLTQAAAGTQLFSALELQMFAVGEETGELHSMLEHVASFHEREVDYDLKRLSDAIEPILMGSMAVLVLILALAVYLPIWDMVKIAHAN